MPTFPDTPEGRKQYREWLRKEFGSSKDGKSKRKPDGKKGDAPEKESSEDE